MADLTGLSISGRVAVPDDPDWDQVRLGMNLAADLRPEAVALVESADDVAKVISFATENDLRVTGQTTGHGAGALADLSGAILIKTERMKGIEVEAGTGSARVEAGVPAAAPGGAAGGAWGRFPSPAPPPP